MRTSDIQEKMIAQMGFTIDDYYADPNLAVTRDIFCSLTRCGPSDEEIEAYLHMMKPYCNAVSFRELLEKRLRALEDKKQAAVYEVEKSENEVAKAKEFENSKQKVYHDLSYLERFQLEQRQKAVKAEIATRKAAENPVQDGQLAALEQELVENQQKIEAHDKLSMELYRDLSAAKKVSKDARAKLKLIKSSPDQYNNDIATIKNQWSQVVRLDEAYFKKDDDALDFLFAVLLGVRIKTKDYGNTFPSLPIALTPAEKMAVIAKHLKKNNMVPRDWRKYLHALCSLPVKRHVGSISTPTAERKSFFERKSIALTAKDLSAFLALKVAALQGEYIVSGAGAIILALPGGLAASITIREKGKVVAKHQQHKVETYVNLLKASAQYTHHLLYNYEGSRSEGLGIETPGAYYILGATYVYEIWFMAAPILMGLDFMTKTTQQVAAKADGEQSNTDDLGQMLGNWEEED